jgi:hypothetical protein
MSVLSRLAVRPFGKTRVRFVERRAKCSNPERREGCAKYWDDKFEGSDAG